MNEIQKINSAIEKAYFIAVFGESAKETGSDTNFQYLLWDYLQSIGIDISRVGTRVFISGPMTGYKQHNYPIFNAVEKVLVFCGCEVVNPATIGLKYNPEKVDGNKTLYKKMEREIQEAEKTCNTIVMLPSWENSVGARKELLTALKQGMRVVIWKE